MAVHIDCDYNKAVSDVHGYGSAIGTTKAKKKAAFMVLVRLMKSRALGSAGISGRKRCGKV